MQRRWKNAAICSSLLCLLTLVVGCAGGSTKLRTRNVILITVDGLRQQELFTGLDVAMLDDKKRSGIEDVARVRELYFRPAPRERRRALFPFFWETLAPQGVVLGNKARGSSVLLKNPLRFSFPGYAELLTGAPQGSVQSNDKIRIGRPTILDFAARKLGLGHDDVAVFASWDVFPFIVTHEAGSFFCNAGYQELPSSGYGAAADALSRAQSDLLTPWNTVRHDRITVELALAFIEKHRPRVFYLALGETDDWAHERRYDRVLAAAGLFDDTLRRLWETIQSIDQYRDRTTIVITTDHGRGNTLDDWTDHRKNVDGAEDIWIAVIGPDTPDRGELTYTPTVYLNDVAATVLQLLDLDATEFNSEAGKAIPFAFAE